MAKAEKGAQQGASNSATADAVPSVRTPKPPQPRARFSQEHQVMLDLLIHARKEAGLSQAALAQKLDKVQSHVAAIEVGGRDITAVELFRWCRIVGLSFSQFASLFEQQLLEQQLRQSGTLDSESKADS